MSAPVFAGGAWQVHVQITGNVVLSVDEPDVIVDSLEVLCDGGGVLGIDEHSGGTFASIEDISKDSNSTGELWLTTITISGDLGVSGSANSGSVSADIVGQVDIGGDLTADVTSGPRESGGVSTISLVRVVGNLVGDIQALYGKVDRVLVTGSIGAGPVTPASLLLIKARDGINEIRATAIAARIEANANSGAGDLLRLETTGGDLFGSVNARRFGAASLAFDWAMEIDGDVSATLTAAEDVYKGMLIDGDFDGDATHYPAGRGLRVMGDLQTGATIEVTGSVGPRALVYFTGDIESGAAFIVHENLDTIDNTTTPDVTIDGTMAGLINIGGQLQDKINITTTNGLTGQIIINSHNATSGA